MTVVVQEYSASRGDAGTLYSVIVGLVVVHIDLFSVINIFLMIIG